MQVLGLLAARRRQRRAVSFTITAPAHSEVPADSSDAEEGEDDGPFFDLDFSSSSSSVRGACSSSSSASSESDDACSDLDFIISLHRSRSASPASYFHETTTTTHFCASEPSNKKAAPTPRSLYGGRPSFASGARSLRLFIMESPADEDEGDASASSSSEHNNNKRGGAASSSGDVIRRYLTSISRRLRRRGTRLRKSRSASAAPPTPSSRRDDDSLAEKQDGIAGAIAHCKDSFRRASLSELDSSLLRSRSDPGKCEASSQLNK